MDTENAGVMLSEDIEKLFTLAAAQEKREQFQEMLETAQRASELDPGSAQDRKSVV